MLSSQDLRNRLEDISIGADADSRRAHEEQLREVREAHRREMATAVGDMAEERKK